jgi:hypothetical protein
MTAFTLRLLGQPDEPPPAVTQGSGGNALAGLFDID